MLEVRKKEEIFPEEVLRVYRGILHLASKLGKFKKVKQQLCTCITLFCSFLCRHCTATT